MLTFPLLVSKSTFVFPPTECASHHIGRCTLPGVEYSIICSNHLVNVDTNCVFATLITQPYIGHINFYLGSTNSSFLVPIFDFFFLHIFRWYFCNRFFNRNLFLFTRNSELVFPLNLFLFLQHYWNIEETIFRTSSSVFWFRYLVWFCGIFFTEIPRQTLLTDISWIFKACFFANNGVYIFLLNLHSVIRVPSFRKKGQRTAAGIRTWITRFIADHLITVNSYRSLRLYVLSTCYIWSEDSGRVCICKRVYQQETNLTHCSNVEGRWYFAIFTRVRPASIFILKISPFQSNYTSAFSYFVLYNSIPRVLH